MKLIKIYQFKRNGFVYYSIDYVANDNPGSVELSVLDWNRSEIVNSLIRTRYSQDRVEAIINNHFLAIGEWLEKKLAGSSEPFVDPDYDELQEWRQICKQWAEEALAKYPPRN